MAANGYNVPRQAPAVTGKSVAMTLAIHSNRYEIDGDMIMLSVPEDAINSNYKLQ